MMTLGDLKRELEKALGGTWYTPGPRVQNRQENPTVTVDILGGEDCVCLLKTTSGYIEARMPVLTLIDVMKLLKITGQSVQYQVVAYDGAGEVLGTFSTREEACGWLGRLTIQKVPQEEG